MLWFKFLGDSEFNYFYLFVKIRAIWDFFFSPASLQSRSSGPVFSDDCAHCDLHGGIRFRGEGLQWKQGFLIFFLIIAYLPLLFMCWFFHSPGLSLGYSKKRTLKDPRVPPDLLSRGPALGVGQAEPQRDGCRRAGWSEHMPSAEFLPETTACLVTPLFLQIRIVCALIYKLYF